MLEELFKICSEMVEAYLGKATALGATSKGRFHEAIYKELKVEYLVYPHRIASTQLNVV